MTRKERIHEINPHAIIIDGFDDAIIGISEDSCKVIYDLYKMQNIEYERIKHRQELTFEDACEYIELNIVNEYYGDFTPIYIWVMPEERDIPEFNYGYGKGDK